MTADINAGVRWAEKQTELHCVICVTWDMTVCSCNCHKQLIEGLKDE